MQAWGFIRFVVQAGWRMNGLRQCLKLFAALLLASPVIAADHIFLDGFDTPVFAGTNVVGMEMDYASYTPATGPVADTNYPAYDTRDIDYFASKGMTAMRFLFSWEAVQANLLGPIPTPDTPQSGTNYADYFANYKRIVDYATDVKNMRVIIEPWQADSNHNAGGPRWRGQLVGVDIPASDFADFWGKMAANFQDNYLVSYGLVNEPNNMSTLTWFADAQAAITAIRASGSTQTIFVPGNGYTAASAWTQNYYDTGIPAQSNAYGWMNADGAGQPLSDPLNRLVIEVHTYLDPDQCGCDGGDPIVSVTAARDQIADTLDWANANGVKMYLGEIGMYAGYVAPGNAFTATDAWKDYVNYFNANRGAFMGFTWWAGGMPAWWNLVNGPYFSISPTDGVNFTGDTVNMQMIQGSYPFR